MASDHVGYTGCSIPSFKPCPTPLMIVTGHRVSLPKSILVNGNGIEIEVVDKFKLLGITLYSKLIFSSYVSSICGRVNGILYSIKRLFYLPLSTKFQFFKTFILPLFDNCLTLSIYYERYLITKLSNCYYTTMSRLFGANKSDCFNFYNKSHDEIQSFSHNIIYVLSDIDCLYGLICLSPLKLN